MKTYRKTFKKATYFYGRFSIYTNLNMAQLIDFPTVLTGYGNGIKSGNWQSCTGINTPDYVIKHYFDGIEGNLSNLWSICRKLEAVIWTDVFNNRQDVEDLIDAANFELSKLKEL